MASIFRTQTGTFRVQIRKDNKSIKSACGFKSRSDAQNWADVYDKKIRKILKLTDKQLRKISTKKVEKLGGVELFEKLGVDINSKTFNQLADEYIIYWFTRYKDTNQSIRVNYWCEVFGNKFLTDIDTNTIRYEIRILGRSKARTGDGVKGYRETSKIRSPVTVNRYKCVLSSIFNYAVEQGDIEENPVKNISVPNSTPRTIERFLSEDERVRLIETCKKSDWPKMYLLVIMAMTTGMRKSELINLRWMDIDFDKNLAKLAKTKNGLPRINPIPSPAMDELKKFRKVGNGYIFPSSILPDHPFEFKKQWARTIREASIEKFRFHDLRHTAASYLVMAGATLHETAEILGHKSTQTTKRYAHLSTAHKSSVSEKAFGALLKIEV